MLGCGQFRVGNLARIWQVFLGPLRKFQGILCKKLHNSNKCFGPNCFSKTTSLCDALLIHIAEEVRGFWGVYWQCKNLMYRKKEVVYKLHAGWFIRSPTQAPWLSASEGLQDRKKYNTSSIYIVEFKRAHERFPAQGPLVETPKEGSRGKLFSSFGIIMPIWWR